MELRDNWNVTLIAPLSCAVPSPAVAGAASTTAAAAGPPAKRSNKKGNLDFVERPSKAQPSPVDTMAMQPGVVLKAADGVKAGPKLPPDAQRMTRPEWRAYRNRLRRGGGGSAGAGGGGSAAPAQAAADAPRDALAAREVASPYHGSGSVAPAPQADQRRGQGASAGSSDTHPPTATQHAEVARSQAAVPVAAAQQGAAAQGNTPTADHVGGGFAAARRSAARTVAGRLAAPLRRATGDLPDWIAQGAPKPPQAPPEKQPSIDVGAVLAAAARGGGDGGTGRYDPPTGHAAAKPSMEQTAAASAPSSQAMRTCQFLVRA